MLLCSQCPRRDRCVQLSVLVETHVRLKGQSLDFLSIDGQCIWIFQAIFKVVHGLNNLCKFPLCLVELLLLDLVFLLLSWVVVVMERQLTKARE